MNKVGGEVKTVQHLHFVIVCYCCTTHCFLIMLSLVAFNPLTMDELVTVNELVEGVVLLSFLCNHYWEQQREILTLGILEMESLKMINLSSFLPMEVLESQGE